MTTSTHIVASTIAVATINIINGSPLHPAPIAVCAFASILPDIDHPQSIAGRMCKPLSQWLYRTVGHRTLTHSIFGWAIVAIVCLPLKWMPIDLNLYSAMIIGYISHAIIDLANLEGVALTYPLLSHHRWVFPGDEIYRVKADSHAERTIRVIGVCLMLGLVWLNLAGAKSVFHSFLGTPSAIGRDYADQLKLGNRLIVRIHGIWTRGQGAIDDEFDVIASTDMGIFVRRPAFPLKIYQISSGPFSAISHARLDIVRRLAAEQRVVKIRFDWEGWKTDLADQYPFALVSGSLRTRAHPPDFAIDEFHTIQQFGDKWELTHAPIELVDQRLKESGSKITGEIQIRYWEEKGWYEKDRSES